MSIERGSHPVSFRFERGVGLKEAKVLVGQTSCGEKSAQLGMSVRQGGLAEANHGGWLWTKPATLNRLSAALEDSGSGLFYGVTSQCMFID